MPLLNSVTSIYLHIYADDRGIRCTYTSEAIY